MLRRTLFLIYISDLPEVMIMLIADDAKIYDRVKQNEQPAATRVQPSLNKGVEWVKKLVNVAQLHKIPSYKL